MSKIQFGININGHPLATAGRPSKAEELSGLAWVRLVFLMHAAVISDHDHTNIFGYDLNQPLDYNTALQRAFDYYDGLIGRYARYGVRTLLILNQETFSGNAPWAEGSDGDWERFTQHFSEICGHIAAHFRQADLPVDYEIWNEGDIKGEASVYVDPRQFAPVLQATSTEILRADPDAKIIFGGLAEGADNAAAYVTKVRDLLNGELPVDAIGIHPYSQKIPDQPEIPGAWFGDLPASLDTHLAQADEHFWITEIGISEPGAIHPQHHKAVADYMERTFDLIEAKYSDRVPVLIWFAWSDIMREAGITDVNGVPKEHIYETFFKLLRRNTLTATSVNNSPYRLVSTVPVLNVRQADGSRFGRLTVVRNDQPLKVIEKLELAVAKLGRSTQYIRVRTVDEVEGWVLASAVEPTAASQPVLADGNVPVPLLLLPTEDEIILYDGSLTSLPKQRDAAGDIQQIGFDDLVAIVEDPQIAYEKVKLGALSASAREYQWVHIRTASGIDGWTAAWFLQLAPDSQHPPQLPPLPRKPVRLTPPDIAEDAHNPEAVRLAEDMLRQHFDVQVDLKTTNEYSTAEKMLLELRHYGVALRSSHQSPGTWKVAEIELVHNVVQNTAENLGRLFGTLYNADDPQMAFRALYAPLSIARDARESVGPEGAIWYAKNSNGFEIIFGGKAFFDGTQRAKSLANTLRRFDSKQLIAHELAHTIGWRYRVTPAQAFLGDYFRLNLEHADGLGAHDGFLFGAQSSGEDYETVADAIACFNLNGFTDDAAGEKRRKQMSNLFDLVIKYRLDEFDQEDLQSLLTTKNHSFPGLILRLEKVYTPELSEEVGAWLGSLEIGRAHV